MPSGTSLAIGRSQTVISRSLVVAVVVVLALLATVAVSTRSYHFLADDSRFYAVIAEHLAAGHGSTFNGLFPTNGYHPLWQGIAACLALVSPSQDFLLTFGTVVGYAFIILTWHFCALAVERAVGFAGVLVFTAVFTFFFIPFGSLIWTEGPVLAVLLALLIRECVLYGAERFVWLGVLSGLAFLSRLDSMFILGSFFLLHFISFRNVRLVLSMAVAAVIALPYLVSNMVFFGHLMPISGAIKNSAARGSFFQGHIGVYGMIAVIGALLLAITAARRPREQRCVFLALSLGTLLQCAYIVAITEGDTKWVWYYVPGYLCLAFGMAFALGSSPRIARLAFVGGIGVSVLCLGAKFFLGWTVYQPLMTNGSWRAGVIAATKAAIPDDGATLFVIDQPGMFAYSTRHPIFAFDGLTGNYALDREISDRGMGFEFSRFAPSYIVAPVLPPGVTVTIVGVTQTGREHDQLLHFWAPYSRHDAGCVSLKLDRLLGRADTATVIGTGVWGIWRIDDAAKAETCPD